MRTNVYLLSRSDNDVEIGRVCNDSTVIASGQNAPALFLFCLFFGFLSVLITCGNLLVIVSVMYFKQLHTPTNYLILSLAVADLLVGVIVLPFSTFLSVSSCWSLASLLCKVRGAFDVFLCAASILNLCFISVDRYYVVCQPLTYRTKINGSTGAVMILVSWAASVLLAAAVTVLRLNQGPPGGRCKIFQSTKSSIMGVVFTSYIPAVVILTLYVRIFAVALRQARNLRNAAKPGAGVSRTELKATKTLAIVVGIYLACWSPYFVCMTAFRLVDGAVPVPMIEAFKWLGWSNSMFNPFVYGFFYKWFRSAFKLIISGKIVQCDLSNKKLL